MVWGSEGATHRCCLGGVLGGNTACPGWMPGPVSPIPSYQPLCLPLLQVHVSWGACRHEHPARQHQCLLRAHHRLHQRIRLWPLCCLQLRGQSQGLGLGEEGEPNPVLVRPRVTPWSPTWTWLSVLLCTSHLPSLSLSLPLCRMETDITRVPIGVHLVYSKHLPNMAASFSCYTWTPCPCFHSSPSLPSSERALCQTPGPAAQLPADRPLHVSGEKYMHDDLPAPALRGELPAHVHMGGPILTCGMCAFDMSTHMWAAPAQYASN